MKIQLLYIVQLEVRNISILKKKKILVGRTGTFLACFIIKKQWELNKNEYKFNIFDVAKSLKNHRRGMIQTLEQYKYIYEWLINEQKKLK